MFSVVCVRPSVSEFTMDFDKIFREDQEWYKEQVIWFTHTFLTIFQTKLQYLVLAGESRSKLCPWDKDKDPLCINVFVWLAFKVIKNRL